MSSQQLDTKDEYKEITIKRDNAPDLRFEGVCIGFAGSSDNNACSNYSGNVGRWHHLNLYKTASNKYVCQISSFTRHQGEHDTHHAVIADDIQAVIDFFGYDKYAKELYDDAGIKYVQKV